MVDTDLAVQMPSSCPVGVAVVVVVVVVVAAAAGGIDAEKDRVSRHVDRSWHIGVGE